MNQNSSPRGFPDYQSCLGRACRLEWSTLGWMTSIILVMYFTMGSSQAMKTAWIEDLLALVPPLAFLMAERFHGRPPDRRFPWGYHRAAAVAFVAAASALALLGFYLLFSALSGLLSQEHPTIGLITVWGHSVWLGWVMMAALLYSALPPVILGRKKLPLARQLHDKTLYTDAAMNQADWMTALAGILGIGGLALGWWWADSLAAALIALDVTHGGVTKLGVSIREMMDETPTPLGKTEPDPIVARLREEVEKLAWVESAEVRLRELGRRLTGDIFIVPAEENGLLEKQSAVSEMAESLDWRLMDLTVMLVREPRGERTTPDSGG